MRARPIGSLLVLLIYLLLALFLFSAAWTHPSRVVGIGPDPLLSGWFLRWVPFAAFHGLNPFLTDYVAWPDGVNLMWNTTFPLAGVVLAPLTASRGPIVGYNALAVLAVTASAWSAYFAVRRYVHHGFAAAAGGLLYGFSPYMVAQSLGHPQLTQAFIPPLLLLLLDEILVRQRRSPILMGGLLGVAGAAQLLTGEELLATEAVIGVLGIILLAAIYPREMGARWRFAAKAFGAGAAAFLVIAAYPLWVQFFGPRRVHARIQAANYYVSDLLGFIVPTPMQALAPGWAVRFSSRFTGNLAEWDAYLGLPLIALLLATAVRCWARVEVRIATILGAMMAALSMGETVHVHGRDTLVPVVLAVLILPIVWRTRSAWVVGAAFIGAWAALARGPVLEQALAGRLTLYVFLMAAIVLAVFLDQPQRATPRTRGLAILAAAIALLPLAPRLPFPSTPVPVPDFFTAAAAAPIPDQSVALIAPFATGANAEARAMTWQAASGMRFRMPEGYIVVPGYPAIGSVTGEVMVAIQRGAIPDTIDDSRRSLVVGELAAWHVRTVVVGPMPNQDRMIAFWQSLLARPPEQVDGVSLWRLGPA